MQKLHIYLVLVLTVALGCDRAEPMDAATEDESPTTEIARTQAILKIQPTDFDPTDKNRMDQAYAEPTSMKVPKNLVGQNKWFMFEGPVLENDLIAYRYYADARHRFDIYGKIVSDLIMDTVGWQYHDIMNWGSDILKVGNSLGIGSPGIWYQDTVYTLSDWEEKTIEVVEQGSARSTVRTTFKGLRIGDSVFDLVQDWSLQAGDYHSEIELKVTQGELPSGAKFVTGVVKHLPDAAIGDSNGKNYLYTFGKQSFHKELLGMAVLADQQYGPRVIEDELSHLMIFDEATDQVRYRFLAAWERDRSKVKQAEDFAALVIQAAK